MKISELIIILENLKNEHGDIRITRYHYNGTGVTDQQEPYLRFVRKKNKRETLNHYAAYNNDIPIEKVIHF